MGTHSKYVSNIYIRVKEITVTLKDGPRFSFHSLRLSYNSVGKQVRFSMWVSFVYERNEFMRCSTFVLIPDEMKCLPAVCDECVEKKWQVLLFVCLLVSQNCGPRKVLPYIVS